MPTVNIDAGNFFTAIWLQNAYFVVVHLSYETVHVYSRLSVIGEGTKKAYIFGTGSMFISDIWKERVSSLPG